MRYHLEYFQCIKGGSRIYNNGTPISQIYLLGKIKFSCHVTATPNQINHMSLVVFFRKGS